MKNQLIGIDAIIARPPQLVVTSAASSVVLGASREPDRLLKMYSDGRAIPQASPAAAVQRTASRRIVARPAEQPHRQTVSRGAEDRRQGECDEDPPGIRHLAAMPAAGELFGLAQGQAHMRKAGSQLCTQHRSSPLPANQHFSQPRRRTAIDGPD